MSFNWLDILLLVILMVMIIVGLMKGLIRQIIGLLAIIIGFVLALFYYPQVARVLQEFIKGETLSQFLGFLLTFLAVIFVGGVLSFFLSKLIKGSIKFFDRLLGAGLGLVKGVLICGILLLAFLLFPVNKRAVQQSKIAPYCLYMTRLTVNLIPQDLKQHFHSTYKEFFQKEERRKNVRRI
ncbi:MAG: CvpA family protein [Acidobacteriota bacterium]